MMNLQKSLTKIALCLIIMLFGLLNKSTAQCTYLKVTEAGQTELTQIPSDFPVLNFSSATEVEKENFKKTVEQWKTLNPGFEAYSFIPEAGMSFITISKTDFDQFDADRKRVIESNPTFYHLN